MQNMSEIILGSLTLVISIRVVYYVLEALALWKIFQKTGEKGWKSLIPFYNDYLLFRQVWKDKTKADVYLLALLVGEFLNIYSMVETKLQGNTNMMFTLVSTGIFLAASVLVILRNFKEAKAFGHGVGFGLGLTLLGPIFDLVLGFGSSKYLGPQD